MITGYGSRRPQDLAVHHCIFIFAKHVSGLCSGCCRVAKSLHRTRASSSKQDVRDFSGLC